MPTQLCMRNQKHTMCPALAGAESLKVELYGICDIDKVEWALCYLIFQYMHITVIILATYK